MAMELLDDVDVVVQGTASQLRSFSVDVHAPAVAGIDQALGVLRNVLPAQRFLRQGRTSTCRFCSYVDR